MRWNGSEEDVASALAILMILAVLVVIGSYLWQLAHCPAAARATLFAAGCRQFLPGDGGSAHGAP